MFILLFINLLFFTLITFMKNSIKKLYNIILKSYLQFLNCLIKSKYKYLIFIIFKLSLVKQRLIFI